jgi:hypothetical protein
MNTFEGEVLLACPGMRRLPCSKAQLLELSFCTAHFISAAGRKRSSGSRVQALAINGIKHGWGGGFSVWLDAPELVSVKLSRSLAGVHLIEHFAEGSWALSRPGSRPGMRHARKFNSTQRFFHN